jgi:cytochrome b561
MKKAQGLLWVNILLLIAVVIQIITVVFRDAMPRSVFFNVHIWCGRTLLTLAVVHLILNWNWVKMNALKFLNGQAN